MRKAELPTEEMGSEEGGQDDDREEDDDEEERDSIRRSASSKDRMAATPEEEGREEEKKEEVEEGPSLIFVKEPLFSAVAELQAWAGGADDALEASLARMGGGS